VRKSARALIIGCAAKVDPAAGATPLIFASPASGLETALAAFACGLATGTLAGKAAAGKALDTALAALPSPATTKVTAI
jgi:hypothetical protein